MNTPRSRPRRPATSVFDAATDSCHPPLSRARAFQAQVSDSAVAAVAVAHRVEPWLARLFLRPMLADLANRDRWTYGPTGFVVRGSETARKDSPLCHAIAIDAARRRILDYQAGHAAAFCRRPTGRPPLDTTAWLSSTSPPAARGRDAVWRYLLRTSSCCCALLTGQALRAFAREQGRERTHDTLARTYRTAAACLHPLKPLIPRATGNWALPDGTRRWHLRSKEGAAKPVITDVRAHLTVTGPHLTRLLWHQPPAPPPRPHRVRPLPSRMGHLGYLAVGLPWLVPIAVATATLLAVLLTYCCCSEEDR